jgi:hypothetical protein
MQQRHSLPGAAGTSSSTGSRGTLLKRHKKHALLSPAAAMQQLTPLASSCCNSSTRQQMNHQQQQPLLLQPAAALLSSCRSRSRISFSSSSSSRSRTASLALHAVWRQQLTAAPSNQLQPEQRSSVRCAVWGRSKSDSSSSSRSSGTQPPDPWQQQQPPRDWQGSTSPSGLQFDSVNGSNPSSPLNSYDPWEDARPRVPVGGVPAYEQTDWGWDAAAEQDWDPAEGLGPEQLADLER